MELTGEMLIGARAVRGTAGTVHGRDPRTGDALAPSYGLGDAADVAAAASLAAAAFGVYRSTTGEQRGALLDTIAAGLEEIAEPLVARVAAETGIAEPRVRGELARTTGQLRMFGALAREGSWISARIDPALPERTPLPRPDLRQRRVPTGPVAVFGASNFPLAFSVAGGDTASALAVGCPVVVKAHSAHPGTSELVGRVIQGAVAALGLPEGVFSLLFGDGESLGVALVRDPRIRAVGFTGSRSGGTALTAAAAARPVPIPVFAEMSSVNPVFLLPGALATRGAELGAAFVTSLTTGAGQLCTNPGLLFAIEGPGLDEFLGAAAAAIAEVDAAAMLTAGIRAAYDDGVSRLREHPLVTEVAAGPGSPGLSTPHLFTTTADAFLADRGLQDEVFGAAALVVRVTGFAEVIDALEGQLTATVHAAAEDLDLAASLLPSLELLAGRIVFDGWPTGVEVGSATVHGGPYPSTSDGRSTSVGTAAIERFLRPVAYQNLPPALRPPGLDDENTLGLRRTVDGVPR
ncbi:aldehyde dehydrogenase (NADP(+)) [Cryptosporangium arvum]|uniref:NAD-dependent aldehyde dehydrogenase n=1 Tax=Cryptosporangium arvum DSM 44712 TaxID=927661 RepID=A0A010ZRN5_9ACTN|nr:aldehyde dehydrogenase (NADP(+)) [Cryptosporangium arvum]EXG81274.1 NAD-dependent aldehyde dehydrogenase [Cryptosporangium arvum DSM 44712]